ncbi:BspA family leucine-rich repeat surface protein [Brachyspira murdochii]|uniref:BspA family leucine-rich repeat surface protein n=1 Tax=Brachyspira murdochii TaxID=84378 RepID=UPI0012F4EE90|nr:BspA family leucine-rich repeat surface protein [Brachyspira murdochii]
MSKYKPEIKEELQKLVQDENIYLGDIDTSLITDMSGLFSFEGRKDFSGIENWNTSNVTNMRGMFYNCYSFNEDIQKWNVSNVKDMGHLFYNCINFNQNISEWNVSNVTDMRGMFKGCTNFNHPLNKWDTSKVKDMSLMFRGCVDFNQPLDNWDTSNVISATGMFMNCRNFNQNINNWNVSKLEYANNMFEECWNFNQPLDKWNTSSVISTASMFKHCINFNQNINNWNVSKLEYANSMFEDCYSFNQPLDKWDTSNLKYISNMFKFCYEFNQPLNTWNTSQIIEMDYVFDKAKKFNQPLYKWDTSNVVSMQCLFYDAESFNQTLGTWKVNKVENMIGMLFRSGFQYYDSLENWNIESLEYLGDWSDVISKNIDKLSLKWILYLYAFDNENKIIIKKIEDNIKEIHKIASEIKNKKVQSAKRKLENFYFNDLKEFLNYQLFDTIEQYEENIKLSKKDEKKVSYIENCNVLIKDKSRDVDIKVIKYIYLKYLELKRDIYYLLEIDSIINLLDRESFLTFAKNIYIETHKEAAAVVYSLYGGDEALREIYKKEKDSNFFLIILSSVKRTEYSIKLLYDIYSKTKKSELRENTFNLINKISKEIGLDIDDLELKFSSNFGFDSRGEKVINDDYKLILNSDYSVNVFDIKNNNVLKAAPKNFDDNTKEEIKYIKNEIPKVIKKLSLKLTKSLMYEKKYNYSFFKEVFIDNPLMNKFSSSLIWNLYDKDNLFLTNFRYSNDGSYSNCEDEEINIDENSFISLASPIEMNEETINKWRKQLEDYELIQPIQQLSIIKLDKNNLENEINKLQNIEISYGTFKAFGARYSMTPSYLEYGAVESYNLKLDNNDYFEIKINANNDIDYKDKVKINIQFSNENNSKVSERFIYTLLILMICDFRLTELFD